MADAARPHRLATLVTQVSDAAELEPAALELRDPSLGPREFLGALAEAGHHADAIKLLAHLLPRREAVWWAWMCARRSAGEAPSPAAREALASTERWIAQPTDENRRAAMDAAQAAGVATAAGSAALAAFLSGGSLAPPGVAEVPPPQFATARAVFGSVMLSAVEHEPEKAPERYARCYADGVELANRIRLWEAMTPGA